MLPVLGSRSRKSLGGGGNEEEEGLVISPRAHAMHTPCTRHAHAMHMPCTRYAWEPFLIRLPMSPGGRQGHGRGCGRGVGGAEGAVGALGLDEAEGRARRRPAKIRTRVSINFNLDICILINWRRTLHRSISVFSIRRLSVGSDEFECRIR